MLVLEALTLNQVPPFADQTEVKLAPRLNLLTGDNGAGKTFLLDLAWISLTQTWKSWPTWFDGKGKDEPSLVIEGHRAEVNTRYKLNVRYSFPEQRWVPGDQFGSEVPVESDWSGPVLYLRSSGGCSVWDPVRDARTSRIAGSIAFEFTPDELLDGLREGDKVFCDGLIRDLVNWQRTRSQAFQQLEKVLQLLSEPGEPLELGEPTRMLPDVRDFPTIKTGYGSIPFIKCSAGVQRIAGLAYLLVWMWDEHLRACEQRRLKPTHRMVVIVDEVECHLHPRWQRLVLPALLKAVSELTNGQVDVQMVISTHAPLVLASVEQLFDERRDALFHFETVRRRVAVSKIDWRAQGEADSWLTSEAFGLETPRSIQAEKAILKAMNAMKKAPEPEGIRKIHRDLHKVLGDTDPFWPRWRYFAEKHGMEP